MRKGEGVKGDGEGKGGDEGEEVKGRGEGGRGKMKMLWYRWGFVLGWAASLVGYGWYGE